MKNIKSQWDCNNCKYFNCNKNNYCYMFDKFQKDCKVFEYEKPFQTIAYWNKLTIDESTDTHKTYKSALSVAKILFNEGNDLGKPYKVEIKNLNTNEIIYNIYTKYFLNKY